MSSLIPRPFAFAVDDLGWNEGSDLSYERIPGPNRAGVKRSFDLRDYKAMVNAAKGAGARVQCLFILSEMDRTNLLAKFPTTTWQRDKWNNTARVDDRQIEIMDFVKEQSAWMEFGLHGTGHEYWAPGEEQKRAEWYNLKDRKPWPEQSLREHIQCFKDIMAQYGIAPEKGHSFPESFVPCAYSYYWNPTGEYSLGKLLTEAGVKFANTDFGQIPELNPPQEKNGGGLDFKTHVINRINYGNVWYQLDRLPLTPVAEQETDIIESHWPNWLAQDDFLQEEVTNKWINYYRDVQKMPNRYIAKNTEQLHAQWLYNTYAKFSEPGIGRIEIDNTAMPVSIYEAFTPGNLVVKIKLGDGKHVSDASINNLPIAAYFEEGGYGFLYLPPLAREKYSVKYSLGTSAIPVHIFNDGTYNVYKTIIEKDRISFNLRVYGTQHVKVVCEKPARVKSSSPTIRVMDSAYSNETSVLAIELSATDMQGSTGDVEITF